MKTIKNETFIRMMKKTNPDFLVSYRRLTKVKKVRNGVYIIYEFDDYLCADYVSKIDMTGDELIYEPYQPWKEETYETVEELFEM